MRGLLGKSMRDGKGFTLVEILIVLALLGLMMAIVVPSLGGFLGRGKDRAYQSDRRVIQAAVDAYYTDTSTRLGARVFPTGNGTSGSAGTNTYIKMDHLVSGGYLDDVPQSATTNNTATSGKGLGTYSWYVDANGKAQSTPTFISDKYP